MFVIAAGGTGGHINAALAISNAMEEEVLFCTGKRFLDYKLFKGKNVLHLNARPLMVKNPLKLTVNTFLNSITFISLFIRFLMKRPKAVIGCGGYVCGPVLTAAHLLFIPCYIIEQNAVMGMTNRLLSIIAKKIFCHFDETRGLKDKYNSKKIVSGNPIRQSIQYRKPVISDEVHVLVFGGSLGATQINDMISTLVEDGFKDRELHILHQVGKGNKFEIGPLGPNIKSYKQHEYIDDMQKAYEWSNVIISRAGASTVSELSIVKKPCILVPYPAATHNHQEINAEIFKKEADFFVGVTNYRLNRTDLTQQVKELLKTSLNHLEKIHHSSQTETAIDIILKEIS